MSIWVIKKSLSGHLDAALHERTADGDITMSQFTTMNCDSWTHRQTYLLHIFWWDQAGIDFQHVYKTAFVNMLQCKETSLNFMITPFPSSRLSDCILLYGIYVKFVKMAWLWYWQSVVFQYKNTAFVSLCLWVLKLWFTPVFGGKDIWFLTWS